MDQLRTVDLSHLRARGTAKWTVFPDDVLPMWIAESDFDTCPAVMDALREGIDNQYFGYPRRSNEVGEALASWCAHAYGWHINPEYVGETADVVRGLYLAITQLTDPGSAIVVPVPAYMPFFELMTASERQGIYVPMIQQPVGTDPEPRWTFDLAAIEDAFANGAQGMILCNPYNPLGRAFTAGELRAVTDLAARYGVRVFSDEIHGPLVYDSTHIPTASVSETAAEVTVTVTATSKGWNTAGLKCAQLIFTNPADAATWENMSYLLKEGVSTLGQLAAIGSYRNGRDWLVEEKDYLRSNRDYLVDALSAIPGLRCTRPEATFLLWLDFNDVRVPALTESGARSTTGQAAEQPTFAELMAQGGPTPATWLLDHARLAVNDGAAFAGPHEHGHGFVRLNFATSRELCERAVEKLLYFFC